MGSSIVERALRPLGEIRREEIASAFLMFTYAFLAMSAYNMIKPATRSKFIDALGADNIPYAQLAAGLLIGVLMAGYAWLMARLPQRWALQIVQAALGALLLIFWYLFHKPWGWVSVAFYVFGLIFAVLVISQFWTLANLVYDARQAKRLFGFIGGGAPLGGIAGSLAGKNPGFFGGTVNLLLLAAPLMILCAGIVSAIILRERSESSVTADREKAVSWSRAFELLRNSSHLRLIALVIGLAAIGAAIIEQQLNMATEATKGRGATDAVTSFLAGIQLYTSVIGLVVQMLLTSRIHRLLGVGFALMILPLSLGATALVMLMNAALWAPGLARVLDQSLRYTVDKTTREILYMPLAPGIKYEAKPFVDVTVDRCAKALGAILLLVLIKPWGLGLNWQQVSYASVLVSALWIFVALAAGRGYRSAFRRSIGERAVEPAEVRPAVADLSTVETLVEELAAPEEARVLYAMDLLESLDKRNLITPLLLRHESPAVRVRALAILGTLGPEPAVRWLPAARSLMADEDPDVRLAALAALARSAPGGSAEFLRPFLEERDPRIAMTAAVCLAQSGAEADIEAARRVLRELAGDARESAAPMRRELAAAIGAVSGAGLRRLLIPLLGDPSPEVAAEALRSVRRLGTQDFFFVPTLVSLLRDRRLKSGARRMLMDFGEEVLPILEHFLRDPGEDIWVRRHIPATIAHIPCRQALDILVRCLDEEDGFLRFKAVAGIQRLRRVRPDLVPERRPLEKALLEEASGYAGYRASFRRLLATNGLPGETLLGRALTEQMARAVDRTYRLLEVLYPPKDVAAARWAIESGDSRRRAAALEYLDNLLKGSLRKEVVAVLEDRLPQPAPGTPSRQPVPKEKQESLIQLVYDRDQVIAAAAIHMLWTLGLANLAGHVEQVLATRDARDRLVLETAAWVLEGLRAPDDKRRVLRHELLPAVEIAERLRRLPLFAAVSVDELLRIAAAGRQVRFEPGSVLYDEGRVPENALFLLDGRLAAASRAGAGREIGAPAAPGIEEVLEAVSARETVRAAEASAVLAVSCAEFRTMLADNTDLVQGLFGMLCRDEPGWSARFVFKRAGEMQSMALPAGPLRPIDKALALGRIALFSEIAPEEMLHLAAIAEEVPLVAGCIVFDEGDPPVLFLILTGALSLESSQSHSPLAVDELDAAGVCETLAGFPFARRARVAREGRALRIERDDLFDLLSQRSELLQQLFGALFRT